MTKLIWHVRQGWITDYGIRIFGVRLTLPTAETVEDGLKLTLFYCCCTIISNSTSIKLGLIRKIPLALTHASNKWDLAECHKAEKRQTFCGYADVATTCTLSDIVPRKKRGFAPLQHTPLSRQVWGLQLPLIPGLIGASCIHLFRNNLDCFPYLRKELPKLKVAIRLG